MKKPNPSFRFALCSALAFAAGPGWLDSTAQAQCCWGSKTPAPYPVGSPYPVANPAQAGAYAAGRPMIPVVPITPSNGGTTSYYGNYGMLPPSSGNPLPNGVPQTVVAAMPTAAYDTQWQRTPVTYYRPVTQYDPNYGTTVTSLQPCTSYQYQAQRVPLVAPTPVGGAYAQASNQWPAINQPGYYPTGALNAYGPMPQVPQATPATTAATAPPVYPQVQYLPATGTVPASATSLPSANFSANTNSGLSSAVYYGNPTTTQALATQPAAVANCPGGTCPTNLTPPNIPGASSVTPMGPVTYLPAQSGVSPAGFAQANAATPSAATPNGGLVLPPSGATLDPASAMAPSLPPPPPATPNTSLMPSTPGAQASPGTGNSGTGNSGTGSSGTGISGNSTSSAGLWSDRDDRVAKMVPMNRQPIVPIDRPSSTNSTAYPTSRSVPIDPAAIASPFPGSAPRATLSAPSLLPSSPSTSNQPAAKPLVAPQGFDAKPHWNPKLLPPAPESAEDKVALRSAMSVK